jgi:hypothetical protein
MKFHELRLPVATRMTLLIQGQDYKTHQCEATLFGYRTGDSVLVTMSKKPAQVLIREGVKLDVRVVMQMGVALFSTRIQQLCTQPFPYLHLDYPDAITMEAIRKYPRFPFAAEVAIVAQTAFGVSTGRMPGRFLDISVNGARIAMVKELSSAVPKLTLTATVVVSGMQQALEVTAVIRRAFGRDDTAPDKPYVYGISFEDVPPLQKLLLLALCHELQSGGPITIG